MSLLKSQCLIQSCCNKVLLSFSRGELFLLEKLTAINACSFSFRIHEVNRRLELGFVCVLVLWNYGKAILLAIRYPMWQVVCAVAVMIRIWKFTVIYTVKPVLSRHSKKTKVGCKDNYCLIQVKRIAEPVLS